MLSKRYIKSIKRDISFLLGKEMSRPGFRRFVYYIPFPKRNSILNVITLNQLIFLAALLVSSSASF